MSSIKEKFLDTWPSIIPIVAWGALIFFAVKGCKKDKDDPDDNPRTWKDGVWHYKDSAYEFKMELDTVYYDPPDNDGENYDPRH